MVTLSRATFLKTAAAAAAATVLAGCSTGPQGSNSAGDSSSSNASGSGAEKYTIKHSFGETTFEKVPEKIAVVQYWQNPDALLALGVAPIGAPTVAWGGNENKSTPWFDAKLNELGAKQPARYDETDGPNFEELAKLGPDAIFCPYGEMNQETYDKLSQIAPVVPAPEGVGSWAASWQQTTEMAGKMLRKEEEAKKVIEDVEKQVKDAAAKHSNLAGATFLAGAFDLKQNSFGAYTSQDTRPRFFSLLGMKQADYVTEHEGDKNTFFINISAEVLDTVKADAVWAWTDAAGDIEKIKSNKLFSSMPALKNDAVVYESNKTFGLALSAASPLSLPWAVGETDILEQVSQAVENSKRASA